MLFVTMGSAQRDRRKSSSRLLFLDLINPGAADAVVQSEQCSSVNSQIDCALGENLESEAGKKAEVDRSRPTPQ